jgi:hypothetical protein
MRMWTMALPERAAVSIPLIVNTGKNAVVPQLALPVRPSGGTAGGAKRGSVTRAERSLEAELKAMGVEASASKANTSPFETGAEIWDLLASAVRNEAGR